MPEEWTVPHKAQQTSGKPATQHVMGKHSSPPDECKCVFLCIKRKTCKQKNQKNNPCQTFKHTDQNMLIIPVTPPLKGNIPVLPESNQSCSVPVDKI